MGQIRTHRLFDPLRRIPFRLYAVRHGQSLSPAAGPMTMASAFLLSLAVMLGSGFLVLIGFRSLGTIYRLSAAIVLLWILGYFLFG